MCTLHNVRAKSNRLENLSRERQYQNHLVADQQNQGKRDFTRFRFKIAPERIFYIIHIPFNTCIFTNKSGAQFDSNNLVKGFLIKIKGIFSITRLSYGTLYIPATQQRIIFAINFQFLVTTIYHHKLILFKKSIFRVHHYYIDYISFTKSIFWKPTRHE